MPARQADPGEGSERRYEHWKYVSTAKGKIWNAWFAGNTHWLKCHTKGRTKPCVKWITYGELECSRCNPFDPTENCGHVPLYREDDGRPVFVIVHEYCREQVDKLRRHWPCIVGRGTDDSDGVWVRDHPKPGARYTAL